MSPYSFSSLSGYDFECLVRDLLQLDLGIRLESFAPGRDTGIDLRYSKDPQNSVIIQCKHYLNSTFSKLKSDMRREVAKVRLLGPSRYVFATSVPLTPTRKAELMAILAPYCKNAHDIYGPDDLNNLLGMHPDTERHHFKLWLTSMPVLQSILHAGILNESAADLDGIRHRICLYVENDEFRRSLSVLTQHSYCVITGAPGIGKTTLARMILMDHLRDGWDVVKIGETVAEAWDVLDRNRKQIFYFDDFLGRTGLKDKLRKNEDQRLSSFIEQVQRSKSTRFILTTREYILNQGKAVYEGLSDPCFNNEHCLVQLSDYPLVIRARLLYNHLFFSQLPDEHIDVFARQAAYLPIIRHKNFSPRIIEWMTQRPTWMALSPTEFTAHFKRSLDNPSDIWAHAFTNQLSVAAQDLMLAFVSLGEWAELDQLRDTFEAFYEHRSRRLGYVRTARDFAGALKELNGSFLVTYAVASKITVGFHNPSVQDFMETYLGQERSDIYDLLDSAHYPSQAVTMWHLACGDQDRAELCRRALRSIQLTYQRQHARPVRTTDGWAWEWSSNESLYSDALRIWSATKDLSLTAIMDELTTKLLDGVEKGIQDSQTIGLIIEAALEGKVPLTDRTTGLADKLLTVLVKKIDEWNYDVADYIALGDVLEKHPHALAPAQIERIRGSFLELLEGSRERISESDHPASELDNLGDLSLFRNVADQLGLNEVWALDSIEEYAEEIRPPRGWSDSRAVPLPSTAQDETLQEISAMFETLRRTSR